MECEICYENAPTYKMNGCTHSICKTCAATMMSDESCHINPFGDYVEIDIILYQLKCPFCRAPERYPISTSYRAYLNKVYEEAYRIWFETELFKDEDGTMYYTSRRKKNVQLFPATEDDIYSLLYRTEVTSRTTACYLDDDNLCDNPDYFIQETIYEPLKKSVTQTHFRHTGSGWRIGLRL